jgi:hypothetical protein
MNSSNRRPPGLLLYSLANACRAGDVHFLLVFGSQREPGLARHAHNFAAFVRASGEGPHVESYSLQVHTISWLPRSLEVRLTSLMPEPGINLDLHATLRRVLALEQRVSQWGPFAVEPILYERALKQVRRLTGGRVRFKAVDTGFPPALVSNAIHAIGDLAEEYPRLRVAPSAFGAPAGALLALRFSPWLLDRAEVYPWVGARLGLGDYPIAQRDLTEHPPLRRRRRRRVAAALPILPFPVELRRS